MRSRYTAYTLKLEGYLLATWHPGTRPERLDLQHDETRWQGLTVKNAEAGRESDARGRVEFVARYVNRGERSTVHEKSNFAKEDGRWFYVDGVMLS